MRIKSFIIIPFIIISFLGCLQTDELAGTETGNPSLVMEAITVDEILASDIAIPTEDTMKIDLDEIKSSSYYKYAVGSNFIAAAAGAVIANGILVAIAAPYVSVLAIVAARLYNNPSTITTLEGAYDEGKLVKFRLEIEDTVSFDTISVSYKARFTAEDLEPSNSSGQIYWQVEFDCISDSFNFCESLPDGYFTYFDGKAPKEKDSNGYVKGIGYWSLKGPWAENDNVSLFSKEIIYVSYDIDLDSQKIIISAGNTGTLENVGDSINFCIVSPNITIEYDDADADKDYKINYNSETKTGNVIYNNGEEACWDSDKADTMCTGNITNVCN